MIAIERIESQFESSLKSHKGKIMSGARERATKKYFKDVAARGRRKQNKVRHDTFRRDEQPTEEDLRLEDIHFANFLGLKDSKHGVPYNNTHIDEPVNIWECDLHKPVDETISAISIDKCIINNFSDLDLGSETDSIHSDDLDIPQIQREATAVWNMNWVYVPETQTLTGYSTFKRGHEEEATEEPAAKRMRSESYEISRMEEGAQVFNEEEATFGAMVAYMREQVALAQQMMAEADELYPCDCLDCRR